MGMLFVCWVSKTKNTIPTLRVVKANVETRRDVTPSSIDHS